MKSENNITGVPLWIFVAIVILLTAIIGGVILWLLSENVGFAGVARMTLWLNWFNFPSDLTSPEVIEFIFSLGALTLFLVLTFHLVFNYSTREREASRAIVQLSTFKNNVEDMLAYANSGGRIDLDKINAISKQFEMIQGTIPSNSDKEHARALKSLSSKFDYEAKLETTLSDITDSDRHETIIKTIVQQSPSIIRILQTCQKVDSNLYVGGGLIRNCVWDYLHGFALPSSIDDVDVVYFDQKLAKKENDLAYEKRLSCIDPNVDWSVKNQARMHIHNNESAYLDLEDAISKWPEQATAMAFRLLPSGDLDFIAPFGFDDLFRLVVRPTPHFAARMNDYQSRIDAKKWKDKWPHLLIFGS